MVLGIVLIVLGVMFIVLGLVSAARLVLLASQSKEPGPAGLGPFDPDKWAKFLDAVTNFVKVAPQWLALSLLGAGMVAWGGTML